MGKRRDIPDSITVKGTKFKISESDRKDKQLKVFDTEEEDTVHFGDPDMPEFPGSDRGDDYCARSLGIAEEYDIEGDTDSANFWSRYLLWNCEGDESKDNRPNL